MRMMRRTTGLLPAVVVVALLFLAWKLLALRLGSAILPQPEQALAGFFEALGTSEFWGHFAASAWRAVAAMALAWAVAFPLGILMGASRRADGYLAPFVFLTYPVPKIVLLPVVLLLLGLGDVSRIAMISIILAYQVLVTTRDGVKNLNPEYVDSIRSMGGGPWAQFREVYLPAALPHGFTALRLGTGVSVAVLFFVESFATMRGLGYLIMDAWGGLDYVRMFTGIFGMSLLGVILYQATNFLERVACRWRFCGR